MSLSGDSSRPSLALIGEPDQGWWSQGPWVDPPQAAPKPEAKPEERRAPGARATAPAQPAAAPRGRKRTVPSE